ncbi:MAG: hypothetical protein M1822_005279 [Bathelium mastoideum]|nr:MAG: hypothetical protein M1822_005279 [Bathelium mastoideum]
MPAGGPPPFQPPHEHLSSLASAITAATAQYSSSPNPQTLRNIQNATDALKKAVTSPMDFLYSRAFQPHINGVIRTAIGMGLFDHLPKQTSHSISLSDLAVRCNADEDLTLRIARTLVSTSIIASPSLFHYSHTPLSAGILTQKSAQAASIYMMDTKVAGIARLGDFFEKYGYKSPDDPQNSPCVFAKGYKDMNFFAMLEEFPVQQAAFNASMAVTANMGGATEAQNIFPFNELDEEGKTILVDVGGGKGQTLEAIRALHPDLKGKMVLQDLKHVLDEQEPVVSREEVEFVPWNFLEEEQPVKGAKAYLLKRILHDWPDSSCQTILRNLKPAMNGHDSRLLICEAVIDDNNPAERHVLQDINMLLLSGKERSMKQWEDLLAKEGFDVVKYYGVDGRTHSIIEAKLK